MSGQWQKTLGVWVLVCCWGWLGLPVAWGAVRVAEVRVGFPDARTGISYGRFGHWLPVCITVAADAGEAFEGEVTVSTPDADGIVQQVTAQPLLRLSAEQPQQTVWAYAQCGHGKLWVEVRDRVGRVVASFVYPDDTGQPQLWQMLSPLVQHIVALGEPAGLESPALQAEERQDPGYRVCRIESPLHLPERWFGYDGVQVLVLATGGEAGRMWCEAVRNRPELAQAWREWVQQGGHLVVCGGERAEWLSRPEQFPLADLLPGEWLVGRQPYAELLIGVREVTATKYRQPTALPALRANWAEFRKKPGASQRAFAADPLKPAVLVWPYGLGQVTLVSFDTNVGAFTTWDGQTAFWEWLLETEPLPVRQAYRTALTVQRETEPLTQLVHQLEQFQAEEIPFALVAGLMLAYVVFAGPLDYLILVRWWRRPALAWFTFPLVVALVSVAAWYSARAIHGEELTGHELVLYDLELSSDGRGRTHLVRGNGSSWIVLKSPRLAAYSLALADDTTAGLPSEHRMRLREAVLGWALRPDDDALQRGQRESLVQGAVHVEPGRGQLQNVPLQAWSMKTLFGRWLLTWDSPPPLCEARLSAPDLNTVRGEVVWNGPGPLLACELTYGNRVWFLGDLHPGHKVAVQRNDVGLLERQRLYSGLARKLGTEPATLPERAEPGEAGDWDVSGAEILRQMTFQRLLVTGRRQSASPYLPFLDQSRRLRYSQAVLTGYLPMTEIPLRELAQQPSLSPTLVRLEPALPGKLRRLVFVRMYLPLADRD